MLILKEADLLGLKYLLYIMERHTDPFSGNTDQILGEMCKMADYIRENCPELKEVIIDVLKNNFSKESMSKLENHPDFEKYFDYLKYIGKEKKLKYLVERNRKFLTMFTFIGRNDIARKENWPGVIEHLPPLNELVTNIILEMYEKSKDELQ